MTQAVGNFANFAAGSVAAVNAVETVVGTSNVVGSAYANSIFVVEFELDFLTGATVTSVVYRIRRTNLTGTAVFTGPLIAAAAATQLPRGRYSCVDQIAGEVASAVWVLTVVQTAGTGNGSATNVFSHVQTL